MNTVAKKLQIKPLSRWLLYNVPANYIELLQTLPDGVSTSLAIEGSFDGVLLFVKTALN